LWLVTILASLAALFILILCLPLDIRLQLVTQEKPRFGIRLAWLFGLVSKEVSKGKKKAEEKRRVVRRKPRRRRIRAGAMLQILRTKGLSRQFVSFLKGILSCLKIRDLGMNLRVGLDNPADTGLLFAFVGPATSFLSSSFPHEIRVQPSFDDKAIFEGYLHGTVRLRPIQLAAPFLRFVFSLATMRAVKTLVLTKWKRKK
jgi:hypothetical protein